MGVLRWIQLAGVVAALANCHLAAQSTAPGTSPDVVATSANLPPDAEPPKKTKRRTERTTASVTQPLTVAERWFLNPPTNQRFDASALLRRKDGTLYTLTDKTPGWYRIDRLTNGSANLIRDPQWFTAEQLQTIASGKLGHWDIEGVAEAPDGHLYFCEELNRWVLRADPQTGRIERLEIDWSPVKKYFSKDRNSSWEGIAIGTNGRMYLANEWELGRIVVVDLARLVVVEDFKVSPPGHASRDVTYSDLCWFDGDLWVLCRQSRHVLRVDPATHRVLGDFDYSGIELSPEHGYASFIPYGQFEGLAVDAESVWLVIDNNGSGRLARRDDIRPTLFRCQRPDRVPAAPVKSP